MWDGDIWGIDELFEELPVDPSDAEEQIQQRSQALLRDAFTALYKQAGTNALIELAPQQPMKVDRRAVAKSHLDKALPSIRRAINACKQLFEDPTENAGWRLFRAACEDARQHAYDRYVEALDQEKTPSTPGTPARDFAGLAREFAKLDGFDITLRGSAVDQQSDLDTAKHWVVPVRAWARNDDWQSEDGELTGSHDADEQVREAYVQAMLAEGLHDDKGNLKDDLLDPDCIEARDWNLSAGQYKPCDFKQLKSDKSVADLIDELKNTEQNIIGGLDRLLAMVEGRE